MLSVRPELLRTKPPPTTAIAMNVPQGGSAMQLNPCPWQGGDVLMNKENGLMYVFSGGELHLIQTTAVYKSIGSPSYKTVTTEEISQCTIGKPLEKQEFPESTKTEDTSLLEATDRNIYALVTQDGNNVLSVKFGALIVEKFRQKELRQCFLVYLDGKIQNVLSGQFLHEHEDCLSVELGKRGDTNITEFVFTPKAGLEGAFSIKAGCGYVSLGKQNTIILGHQPYFWKLERIGRV